MVKEGGERGKSEELKKAKSPSLLALLAPSILSICLSIICLCGLTWAWFADSVSNNLGTIEAGNVLLEVSYSKTSYIAFSQENATTESFITLSEEENGFQLQAEAGTIYHVKVINRGTVNGYIVISNSVNSEKYVASVETNWGGEDRSIEFGIVCRSEEVCNIQIQSYWGKWESNIDYESCTPLSDLSGQVDLVLLSQDVSVSDADSLKVDSEQLRDSLKGTESNNAFEKDVQVKDVSASDALDKGAIESNALESDVSGSDAKIFEYPIIVIQ